MAGVLCGLLSACFSGSNQQLLDFTLALQYGPLLFLGTSAGAAALDDPLLAIHRVVASWLASGANVALACIVVLHKQLHRGCARWGS